MTEIYYTETPAARLLNSYLLSVVVLQVAEQALCSMKV